MEGVIKIENSFILVAVALVVSVFCYLEVSAQELDSVLINEIMWDGTEYVELYNVSSQNIDLENWVLTRQQVGGSEKNIVTFSTGDVIGASGYYLLEKKEEATSIPADKIASGLTLVNTGELVRLYDDANMLVDIANQMGVWFAGQNTTDGIGMERVEDDEDGESENAWYDSTGSMGGRFGTPGSINSEPYQNNPPQAVAGSDLQVSVGQEIIINGEDSSDEDGDDLAYVWSLGNGENKEGMEINYIYLSAGTYTVTLTVSDSEFDDEDTMIVTVVSPIYSDDIVINEFLPDPEGSDSEGEFIELKNVGILNVNLLGWMIDDVDGGSSVYTISDDIEIAAGGIVLFNRAETKLALNNGGDTVRLLNPVGEIVSSYIYSTSNEGISYNREGSAYSESTTVTPGKENIITVSQDDDEIEQELENEIDEDEEDNEYVSVELKNVREEDKGTLIETEGIVSVPPGIFGDKIIYLAGSGIQVYFSKEDYPNLMLGDKVSVKGELTTSLGEYRLKLAFADDVEKMKAGEPPVPHVVKTGDVDESMEGTLVTIQGYVSKTSGDTFYIDDDSGEVKIFIKGATNIDKPKMKKGMAVTVTGVVSRTNSGYRILPRFQEDIRMGLVAGLESFPATGINKLAILTVLLTISCYQLVVGIYHKERIFS